MKNLIRLVVLLMVLANASVNAQRVFVGKQLNGSNDSRLSRLFKEYALFDINTKEISAYINANNGRADIVLQLPGKTIFNFGISPYQLISENYTVRVSGEKEVAGYTPSSSITFKAHHADGTRETYITISPQLLFGMFSSGEKSYFIEPLRYLEPGASAATYVVYEPKDIIDQPGNVCGVKEVSKRVQENSFTAGSATGTCKLVQLAIASDATMTARYGNVQGVLEHNIAVLNSMNNIYSNAQIGTSYLEFKIVGQYVSTNTANDPLSPQYTGFEASTILSNFTNWGQVPANFGVTFDVGEFWTARDIGTIGPPFNNGVVGLGWVGTVCGGFRYHILEASLQLTGLGQAVDAAHETGHNFNASHDASGAPYVMAPSISSPPNVTFSPASLTAMSNFLLTISCLSSCNAQAPTAAISVDATAVCTGSTVTFTDNSTGQVASRAWTFPGGSPSSSLNQAQTVTYNTAGTKTATLTVVNASGTDVITKNIYVANAITVPNCRTTFPGNSETPLLLGVALANISHGNSVFYLSGTYNSYTCSDITKLSAGTTYTVTLNLGLNQSPYNISNKAEVFIDYNNDGDFLDANEIVLTGSACTQGNFNFNFTTPASPPVLNQLLRMRVIAMPCALASSNGCSVPSNSQAEDYAILFTGAVVPVTLLNFSGKYADGNNVLNWQTGSEINNSYYEIQRSAEGLHYQYAGRVNASANTSTGASYQFTDQMDDANVKRYYYRLKMVDNDGSFEYSNIVVIDMPVRNELTVYPNPVRAGSAFQLDLRAFSANRLQIFNAAGQLMFSKNISVAKRLETIETNRSWPAGVYTLKVSSGTDQKILRVILY